MKPVLDDEAFDQLFRSARTYPTWRNRRATYAQIHALHELLRYGPTRMNCQPARYLFPCTSESKARLAPALLAGNVAKVKAAPVTAVVAHDSRFFDRLPDVWPRSPASADMYASNAALAQPTAFRNGTLQGAYLILAARAVGLAGASRWRSRRLRRRSVCTRSSRVAGSR